MAKIVDITDKLSFDEKPNLVVKGKKLEVNDDAPTMLKIMGLLGDDDPSAKSIMEAYEMIFTENAKAAINKMKLSFKDFVVVVQEAVNLITGNEDNGGGEQ